jgi:isorenieratene synthase
MTHRLRVFDPSRIPRLPKVINFGRALPRLPEPATPPRPDWQAADPRWIKRALARSQELPTGGWYVLGDSLEFSGSSTGPRRIEVAGLQLVLWRAGLQLMAARDVCPHMGAALSEGRVCGDQLICPWHGLALGPGSSPGFRPLATHDDGHLAWVQLPAAEPSSPRPYLPTRPAQSLSAVIAVDARCAPSDVIANRLDPWHGVHYHPHSFGRLRVIEQSESDITVRVAYRVAGPLAVEVDARFHCTDARTIAMTIVRGDGLGSVVETHATPIREGLTRVIELTLASSDRPGFSWVQRAAPVLRPVMRWAATRLWVEDARYAERLYALRKQAASSVAADSDGARGRIGESHA